MSALCFLVLTATIAISGGAQDWQRVRLEQMVRQLGPIRPGQSFWLQIGKPGRPGRPGGQQSLWQQQLWNQFSRQAPSWRRPVRQQPGGQYPFIQQPGQQQPSPRQPGRRQPSPRQPGGQYPARQQPGGQYPGRQQPGWQQPSPRQPGSRQPSSWQPGSRQPSSRQPDSRQPSPWQPGSRQPSPWQPDSRQPSSRQPDSRQPSSRQPDSRQPSPRQPGSRQPSSRQPDSRQPSSRQPDSRQPSSRRPGSRQPSARNDDYCNVKSCKRPELHTSCKFLPGQISPACGKVESSFMNRAERDKVLEKHNDFRAKVARGDERRGSHGPQPAAKNLGNLTWNDELAEIAQKWANQCIWGHDECRDTHEKKVGQNIAYSSSSESYNAILSDLVTGWYDEVKNFNSAEVRLFKGQSPFTGHYSQLVWAKSTEVGCGLIRFNHPVSSKGQYRTQLVCNYATKGNMIDQPVYQQR